MRSRPSPSILSLDGSAGLTGLHWLMLPHEFLIILLIPFVQWVVPLACHSLQALATISPSLHAP